MFERGGTARRSLAWRKYLCHDFMNQGKLQTMKHIPTRDTNFIQVSHSLPGMAVYRLIYKLYIMSLMHMWDYCIGESDVNMFF